VFCCVLGSEGCVLVPRSSGTPLATWAWPIWVVSRRRVLEAVFILLEFPSPSRRIFIGSHSLHPLWFAVSVLQSCKSRQSPKLLHCRHAGLGTGEEGRPEEEKRKIKEMKHTFASSSRPSAPHRLPFVILGSRVAK
jgi:hypothetical protein